MADYPTNVGSKYTTESAARSATASSLRPDVCCHEPCSSTYATAPRPCSSWKSFRPLPCQRRHHTVPGPQRSTVPDERPPLTTPHTPPSCWRSNSRAISCKHRRITAADSGAALGPPFSRKRRGITVAAAKCGAQPGVRVVVRHSQERGTKENGCLGIRGAAVRRRHLVLNAGGCCSGRRLPDGCRGG